MSSKSCIPSSDFRRERIWWHAVCITKRSLSTSVCKPAVTYMSRSPGSKGKGASNGSRRRGQSRGMPSKPVPGESKNAERARRRIKVPSDEFRSRRSGGNRLFARWYNRSFSSPSMLRTLDFANKPEGHLSPLGKSPPGKKLHCGLTKPDDTERPRKSCHIHESWSPSKVGIGWESKRRRWL